MTDNPRDPFERFQREVERLFHDMVYRRAPGGHLGGAPWQPLVDLIASNDRAWVRVELPGVSRQDFRVSLQGNLLRVWGRRRPPRDVEGVDYHRAEIFYGPFERIIELPWHADEDQIEARHREGFLEIQLVPLAAATPTDVPVEREAED